MSVNPTDPQSFPRRVLLALGGMSPQVVTETLYCLCVQAARPFVPTEVHLITTSTGKTEAIDGLLDADGEFHQFVDDYDLAGCITFSVEHLHTLFDASGHPLKDIRSAEDNIAAADEITEKIRQLTSDPDCALHVSISGGRNTLGFYLGYALSMFGRPQDRLSHVLVNQEFQNNRDFYYPPPEPEIISTRFGQRSTALTGITLAEIPFIRLRHGLPNDLLEGRSSYSQTIAAIDKTLAPPRLRIQYAGRKIWCADVLVEMPPQLFAWYTWLAGRRQTGSEQAGHICWRDPGIEQQFLHVYRDVVGALAHDYEATQATLSEGMTRNFFDEKKSRVNRWLEEILGKVAAIPYQITASGQRPRTRYGLVLDPQHISILRKTAQ